MSKYLDHTAFLERCSSVLWRSLAAPYLQKRVRVFDSLPAVSQIAHLEDTLRPGASVHNQVRVLRSHLPKEPQRGEHAGDSFRLHAVCVKASLELTCTYLSFCGKSTWPRPRGTRIWSSPLCRVHTWANPLC